MSRWFRVQASIFEHAVFADEPFSEREAWLWLISKAAWKDTKHRIGHSVVDVPAGSMFLTLREMQAAWRWKSDFRVRSFLKLLQDEGMIVADGNAGKTQISICNYSRYQGGSQEENAAGTHGKRTENALKTPVHQDTSTSSLRSEDKPTPRRELEAVLDADHADALVEHRQKIRKPLTARGAKLLAADLAKWPDPNAAADAMIKNGWQGFDPAWMENRRARSSPATAPPRKTTLASMWRDEAKNAGIIPDERIDENRGRVGTGHPAGPDSVPGIARRIAGAGG